MTTDVKVSVNRDATAADARDLLAGHKLLVTKKKALTDAIKLVSEAWLDGNMSVARSSRDVAQAAFDQALDQVWEGLATIPANTNAPGGMNVQTVSLEWYNSNINRDGGRRLTAGAARKINQLSASL